MSDQISDAEARLALDTIDLRHRQVLARIDIPRWYWWGLAGVWVALGIISDLGNAWLGAVVTLAFGATHAAISQRVISGRHGSRQLSVRADVVSRHVPALVIGFLLVLVAATVGIALLAQAGGVGHPAIVASVIVAIVLVLGGPMLMAAVRRRAEHRVRA